MTLRLFEGDCLEVMKGLGNNSVDCFICDLPYGCLTGGGGQEKKRRRFKGGVDTGTEIIQTEGLFGGCSWDVKIDLGAFWEQVKRLAKDEHTPVLMFCTTKFGIDLINSNPSWFRYDLVWDKGRGVSFLQANKMPMRSHEMIYVFSKAGAYYKRVDKDEKCVKTIITVAGSNGKGKHPTEKPMGLYEWLIERYCPADGTVLDPTAGSFNSCFAALGLGRNAIGIEKDAKFYKKARDRADGAAAAADAVGGSASDNGGGSERNEIVDGDEADE